MRLVYCDQKPSDEAQEGAWGRERVSLGALLSSSNFVVSLLPLTPQALHLINAESISQMKNGA